MNINFGISHINIMNRADTNWPGFKKLLQKSNLSKRPQKDGTLLSNIVRENIFYKNSTDFHP